MIMSLTRDKLAQHNKHFPDHDRYAIERIHAFVQEQCHLQDPNEPAIPNNPGPLTRIHMARQQKCRSGISWFALLQISFLMDGIE